MLNTTICHEDDSLRSYVAKFIEQYFKRNHIQYKISCCPSLHNLTTRFHPIDLLFTDIIFSDKTAMSTLLKIRKQHLSMMMVILTNNNEYSDVYQLITTKPGERKKQEGFCIKKRRVEARLRVSGSLVLPDIVF